MWRDRRLLRRPRRLPPLPIPPPGMMYDPCDGKDNGRIVPIAMIEDEMRAGVEGWEPHRFEDPEYFANDQPYNWAAAVKAKRRRTTASLGEPEASRAGCEAGPAQSTVQANGE